MAHNLEIYADRASFVSRQVAWHQLGTIWPEGFTLEAAMAEARADYTVSTVPVFAFDGSHATCCDGKVATVRERNGRPVVLGVVSDRYQVVQNTEAFGFADALVDGGAEPDTVGVLGNGERAFVTFKLGDEVMVGGEDAHSFYLVAINGHDGHQAVDMLITPVRAVCQNTVRLAIAKAKSRFSLRHTASVKGRMEEARRALELSFAYAESFTVEAERLLATPVAIDEFLAEIFPVPAKASNRNRTMVERKREAVAQLYYSPTHDGIRDSAWGAFNAYVEWLDFARPTRGGSAHRLEATVTGDTDPAKARALAILS